MMTLKTGFGSGGISPLSNSISGSGTPAKNETRCRRVGSCRKVSKRGSPSVDKADSREAEALNDQRLVVGVLYTTRRSRGKMTAQEKSQVSNGR